MAWRPSKGEGASLGPQSLKTISLFVSSIVIRVSTIHSCTAFHPFIHTAPHRQQCEGSNAEERVIRIRDDERCVAEGMGRAERKARV